MPEYITLGAAMLATGVVGGILAGLLGVGGGIVIVPVLDAVLELLGADPAMRMQIAVATSLATIIPTSLSSTRSHHQREAVDVDLAKRWIIFIFGGAVIGSLVASRVHSNVLAAVFGIVALIVSVKMILPLDDRPLVSDVPRGLAAPILPSVIGFISSMMGIGGGTLSVPILTLCNEPVHRAVGTSALFGLLISVPATLAFVYAGWDVDFNLPGQLGYVNLIGFLLIVPATVVAAPLGARIAHALTRRALSVVFGVFLFVVACRMLYQLV